MNAHQAGSAIQICLFRSEPRPAIDPILDVPLESEPGAQKAFGHLKTTLHEGEVDVVDNPDQPDPVLPDQVSAFIHDLLDRQDIEIYTVKRGVGGTAAV